VDHATPNCRVIRYSSSLALAAKKRKLTVVTSWRMDETTIKIKGNGLTYIEPLLNPATPLISCFLAP